MIPEWQALARRAVACPRWRWMPGMRWVHTQIPRRGDGPSSSRVRDRRPRHGKDVPVTVLPDLTDPATLGCLLALVREAHGPSTVARLVGVNGRGGQEWAICDRAPAVDGWHLAAPALGYWESEVEALVAALENGGGGA